MQNKHDRNQLEEGLRSLFKQERHTVSRTDAKAWIKAELEEQVLLDQQNKDKAAAIEAETIGLRKREALRQLMAIDLLYNALIGSGIDEDILQRNHGLRAEIDRRFPTTSGDEFQPTECGAQRTPEYLIREASMQIYAEIEGYRIPKYRHMEGKRARQPRQQLTDVQTLPLSFWRQ